MTLSFVVAYVDWSKEKMGDCKVGSVVYLKWFGEDPPLKRVVITMCGDYDGVPNTS